MTNVFLTFILQVIAVVAKIFEAANSRNKEPDRIRFARELAARIQVKLQRGAGSTLNDDQRDFIARFCTEADCVHIMLLGRKGSGKSTMLDSLDHIYKYGVDFLHPDNKFAGTRQASNAEVDWDIDKLGEAKSLKIGFSIWANAQGLDSWNHDNVKKRINLTQETIKSKHPDPKNRSIYVVVCSKNIAAGLEDPSDQIMRGNPSIYAKIQEANSTLKPVVVLTGVPADANAAGAPLTADSFAGADVTEWEGFTPEDRVDGNPVTAANIEKVIKSLQGMDYMIDRIQQQIDDQLFRICMARREAKQVVVYEFERWAFGWKEKGYGTDENGDACAPTSLNDPLLLPLGRCWNANEGWSTGPWEYAFNWGYGFSGTKKWNDYVRRRKHIRFAYPPVEA